VEVRSSNNFEWNGATATNLDENGTPETALLWAETRGGYGVFIAQIVDHNGQGILPDGGVQISRTIERKWFPSLTPDPDGGWIAVWYSVTGLQFQERMAIRYTKFSREGHLLWEEGLIEANAYNEFGREDPAPVVPDGEGGCYIFWLDIRGGDNVYGQHILANGAIDQNWQRTGLPVINRVWTQDQIRATTDGQGGAYVVCRSHRERFNGDILAQRVTPDGRMLWGGVEGVAICDEDSSDQALPEICSDGANGAFITWCNTSARAVSLQAQRVNSAGELYWGNSQAGASICDQNVASGLPTTIRLLATGEETATVMWQVWQGGNLSDIYGQRFGGGEEGCGKLWQHDQGMPIVTADGEQRPMDMIDDGAGGVYCLWMDARDRGYPEEDTYMQRLTEDGEPLWRQDGNLLAEGAGNPFGTNIELTEGGCSLFWIYGAVMDRGLFVQQFDAGDGGRRLEAGGRRIVSAPILGGGTFSNLITQIDDNDAFALIWKDGRFGGFGMKPMIQFYTHHQEQVPREAPGISNGIGLIELDSSHSTQVSGIADGEGGVIALWGGELNNRTQCYKAQKITVAGNRLWGDEGLVVKIIQHNGGRLDLVSDGEGGAIFALVGFSEAHVDDIYLQRVSREGEPLWGEDCLNLTSGGENWIEAIAGDGEGGAVVVWTEEVARDSDLKFCRLDSEGNQAWEQGIQPLCNGNGEQRDARIATHPNGWFVTWVDYRDRDSLGIPREIYGQFINRDGSFLGPDAGMPICAVEGNHTDPVVTVDVDGFIWVAWESTDRPGNQDWAGNIYLQKINPSTPDQPFVLDPGGFPVCGIDGNQESPAIVNDGQDGVYLAWVDHRENLFFGDLYTTHLAADGFPASDGWTFGGDILCDAYYKQEQPQIALARNDGSSGVIAAWRDKRATDLEEVEGLYMQRVAMAGEVGVDHLPPLALRPTSLILSIFPNPFNSSTTINYSLPSPGRYAIDVIDIQGRLVTRLSDGWKEAGSYREVWSNPFGQASGNYFVRLQGDQSVQLRQIEFVK